MFWLPLAMALGSAAAGGVGGAMKNKAAKSQEEQDRAQLASEQRYGWILDQTPTTKIRKAGSAFSDIGGGLMGGALTGASLAGAAGGLGGMFGTGAGPTTGGTWAPDSGPATLTSPQAGGFGGGSLYSKMDPGAMQLRPNKNPYSIF